MGEPKVTAILGLTPEVDAFSTVRCSRSSDTKQESIEWIHRQSAAAAAGKAQNFLDTYYFQYGHKSIADCGHPTVAVEQFSQLTAEELEDEQLWDGQEQSTRYQDFSKPNYWVPPNWTDEVRIASYHETMQGMYATYHQVSQQTFEYLCIQNPKPEGMKQGDYDRALIARAFDVARYLLPMATKTNISQITSIRTLERQIQRLLASRFAEIRLLGEYMATACKEGALNWPREQISRYLMAATKDLATREDRALVPFHDASLAIHAMKDILVRIHNEVLDQVFPDVGAAPTLAKYLTPDNYLERTRARLAEIARDLLKDEYRPAPSEIKRVDLVDRSAGYYRETIATALYWVSNLPYRQLISFVQNRMSDADQIEVWKALFSERDKHDELLRLFRGEYSLTFDLCVDIGADRDLKRHRRCIQTRQDLGVTCGYEIPSILDEPELTHVRDLMVSQVEQSHATFRSLSDDHPYEALYVLPLATRRRRLYKMDPAELVYISELRTGVGGHFSYRAAAYEMFEQAMQRFPYLREFIEPRVTHPSIEAPLQR